MNPLQKLILGSVLAMLAAGAQALTPEEVRQKLLTARPDLPVNEVRASTLDGFFEATLPDGTILFVNADASHFVVGDLFRIDPDGFVNVSEEKRNDARKEMLDALDPKDMVVFSPAEGMKKASITVFTDIDCGYCRKLHQEVPELNRMGIEVRYLAYPRAGLDSPSYDKFVSAWCADNQQVALTKAKLGEPIEPRTCDNPVAAQYKLGGEMGVTGTPAILFDDGRLQPGYLPAAQMAARLGVVN